MVEARAPTPYSPSIKPYPQLPLLNISFEIVMVSTDRDPHIATSDRIVVKADQAEETTASGIILPDTAKEKPQIGTVVNAGPGKTNDSGILIKMTLKKGDKVLYGKYSGTEVNIAGEELLIMRESDILATL